MQPFLVQSRSWTFFLGSVEDGEAAEDNEVIRVAVEMEKWTTLRTDETEQTMSSGRAVVNEG